MGLQSTRRQWDALGRLDPLWAMTGVHRYGSWDLEAFLATGDRQVDQLMQQDVPRLGLPRGRGAVLDFGCGVGRQARGFRSYFDTYLGLDVAESLVMKAREIHAGLSQATFDVNLSATLDEVADSSFDLVYCWGVFQHIADRTLVRSYMAELLRLLRPDGLLVFSAMTDVRRWYRLQPRRRAYALLASLGLPAELLYHRLGLYPQQVHTISEDQIRALVGALGAVTLEVRPISPPGSPHQVRSFFVAHGSGDVGAKTEPRVP